MRARRESGATLIELVISIVVIAIAASAVLGVLSSTVGRSADAMVLSQGVAIAEAYLEEITLKPFADPDGVDGEAARPDFDDVDDYDGLVDLGARDQFGTALAPLAHYTVTVTVAASTALTGVPGGDAERIDVRVTHPSNATVALTGYKTRL
jgi:MSHA pilin protein MshD